MAGSIPKSSKAIDIGLDGFEIKTETQVRWVRSNGEENGSGKPLEKR